MAYFSKRLKIKRRKSLYPISMAEVTVNGACHTYGQQFSWGACAHPRVWIATLLSFPTTVLTCRCIGNLNKVNCTSLEMKSRGGNESGEKDHWHLSDRGQNIGVEGGEWREGSKE